jgi:hypothetical protein
VRIRTDSILLVASRKLQSSIFGAVSTPHQAGTSRSPPVLSTDNEHVLSPLGRCGLFVFNSSFAGMNQDHRSASSSRQRFDRPPPHPKEATLPVGPLAASVRTEASVTPCALKTISANFARKHLDPLCGTKVPRIAARASTLHVVDQTRLSAVCTNYGGHALRIHGVLDSHYGYL